MKMIVNTVLKKVMWLNLFAIIFCIVGCLEDRTPQKPPLQIPWIGDKRVGPGGISIPAGDNIHIGVSSDPENPQIKIKPGKGEIVIRIDVNKPHRDKNGNPVPPHVNIQRKKRNIHSHEDNDNKGKTLKLNKDDRITIKICDGKVIIEKSDKESIEYELPDTEGLDITVEQEPGGKRTIVKKGDKVIGIIEIGEDATRIKVGDKEIEIPHNDEEEQQKENDGEPEHENDSEGTADNEKGVNDKQKGLELRIQICPYLDLSPDILPNPDPEPEIGSDVLPEPMPIPELGPDLLPEHPIPELGPDVLPNPDPEPEIGPDLLPGPKPIPELGPDVLPEHPIPERGPDVLPNPKPFPGILPRPLPKPEAGGVYIDVKISPDSFTNEDKKENKSDAIEKSRPNKDSVSWKFKCKE